jgi:hypothetical protein
MQLCYGIAYYYAFPLTAGLFIKILSLTIDIYDYGSHMDS